jgi:hypothetical protein
MIPAAGQRLNPTGWSPRQVARGVCGRASSKYGKCDWDKLHAAIQELIVDLKYRGDYTPTSREVIQPPIVANDLEGLAKAMADRSNWKSVPATPQLSVAAMSTPQAAHIRMIRPAS